MATELKSQFATGLPDFKNLSSYEKKDLLSTPVYLLGAIGGIYIFVVISFLKLLFLLPKIADMQRVTKPSVANS